MIFRVPILSSLCNLLLRSNHLDIPGLLLGSLIHIDPFLSGPNYLYKIARCISLVSVSPLLSPLLHGIITDLFAFLLELEFVLRALHWFRFFSFFVEVLSGLDHTSRLRGLLCCWLG
jgi:hypothetical protein